MCAPVKDQNALHLPIELGPGPNAYVLVSCAVGFPAVIWVAGILEGRRMAIQLLVYCVLGVVCVLLYIKNMTIRLDEAGISQGFSVFRTFMPYETVAGVHREVRSAKGASTTVFVITKRNSASRIVINLRSFDRIKLASLMSLLARKAPQAHIEDALYVQFNQPGL